VDKSCRIHRRSAKKWDRKQKVRAEKSCARFVSSAKIRTFSLQLIMQFISLFVVDVVNIVHTV